ncbi:MAG: hypothetical protein QNJ91_04370 [Gammaproteobacteria bacterium]|nr:hypothetical protein [Gammaproteobacteria bacterium]
MSSHGHTDRGRKPRRVALSAVLWAALACASFAAEDPYLELLDAEATKVDGNSTDTAEDDAGAAPRTDAAGSAEPAPSRGDFEAQLRNRHVGTYSFYRRLPERSREEIFIDYSNGASLEALRSKIIDRYLHP